MSCPKVPPNYPVTARYFEMPYDALVRKVEPDFDKLKRFDPSYEFGGRRKLFFEDSINHGAYRPVELVAEQGFAIEGLAIDDPSLPQLAEALRRQNGDCDPFDDGTVFTGTGAGGANPGSVPSRRGFNTESGVQFVTEDGTQIQADPLADIGVVFKGA